MLEGKFFYPEGVLIEETSDVMMKVCDGSQELTRGQIVSFEPAELHEMGRMFIHSITQTADSVLKLAKAAGIHNEFPSLG